VAPASCRLVAPSLLIAVLALPLGACAPTTRVATLPSVSVEPAAAVATPAPPRHAGAHQEGVASWYGPGFAGRTTANGEVFDPSMLTAAHRTLPFGTRVLVTNLSNGRNVEVRINDRGPFKAGRVIDLSRAAAEHIGMLGSGTARVRLEVITGLPNSTRLAGVRGLREFEALAPTYAPGQLLVLRSPRTSEPVLVRVVGGTFPVETNADIVVADEVFLALGPEVDVSFE
jgi:rare lipoprotein A